MRALHHITAFWLGVITLGPALGLIFAPACAQPASATAPELESRWEAKPAWRFAQFAVASAHPLASEAGAQMIRKGGSTIDAAIATQLVLGLVEPQSSGLGGGGFLVVSHNHTVTAYDGRETAPMAISPHLFIEQDGERKGEPMAFSRALVGGRAVGVPGLLAMLYLAHQDHGRLPWPDLFEPAIALAVDGFPIGHRLHSLLARDPHLRRDPASRQYFYDEQERPWPVGHRLKNPALAEVLRGVAAHGPQFFYEGAISEAIARRVQTHSTNPGFLTQSDLARYRAVKREALCFDWKPTATASLLRVCGSPPPSSGTIAIGQILGILQQRPDLDSPADRDHTYLEAARLAFADRDQYLADPDFSQAPSGAWSSLLQPEYLKARASQITSRSLIRAVPGTPLISQPRHPQQGMMPTQPEAGTTHVSVIDSQGNALALTSSIESAFGARMMVSGILLNNQLTDFSFPFADNRGNPIANKPEPGKRPRSSMSPIIVLDASSQRPIASLGSAGGAMIIHYVSQALRGVFADHLSVQASLEQAWFGSLNGPSLTEKGRFPQDRAVALKARGAEVRPIAMTSGTHMLLRHGSAIFAGADPRREGWVAGD